jgi:hypothetical protein
MKFFKIPSYALVCALVSCLSLAGCGDMKMHMPTFNLTGPKYKPLDSDVAAMAAPQSTEDDAGPNDGLRRLYCRVGNGSARFGTHWYDYDSDDFRLMQGARVNVTLTAKKNAETMSFLGFFDDAGQKMVFCPVVAGPPDKRIPCASLYALDDDLALGIKRTFDLPNAVRGANITCAFRRDKLRKL